MIGWAKRAILGTNIKALALSEALLWLETTGASLIRWGDGETEILYGKSINFQGKDSELSNYLSKLLIQDRPDIVVGIPVGALTGYIWRHFSRRGWIKTRLIWSRHVKEDRIYVDAFIFRDEPQIALMALKSMVARRAYVLVVSSNPEDISYFRDLPCPSRWISIPAENAFRSFHLICAQIRSVAMSLMNEKNQLSRGIILISAGPTAKALVAELSPSLCCYDVGHLFHFQRFPKKRNVWTT